MKKYVNFDTLEWTLQGGFTLLNRVDLRYLLENSTVIKEDFDPLNEETQPIYYYCTTCTVDNREQLKELNDINVYMFEPFNMFVFTTYATCYDQNGYPALELK